MIPEGTRAGELLVVSVRRARGAIGAGVGSAGIHLSFTSLPVKRRLADAEEVIDPVDTRASVLAGTVGAVVDVDLAVVAGVSWLADALVGAELVVALAAVLARVGVALVDLLVAGGAAPARGAVADEP